MTIFGIPIFKIVLFFGVMLIVATLKNVWTRKTKFPFITNAKCIRFDTKTINEEEIKVPVWQYKIRKNEYTVQDPRFRIEYKVNLNEQKEICCHIEDKNKFMFNKEKTLRDILTFISGVGLIFGGILLYINYLSITFSS